MTKEEILRGIRAYATGFLSSRDSVQRRILALHDIEFCAQQARENLEAVMDSMDEEQAWENRE